MSRKTSNVKQTLTLAIYIYVILLYLFSSPPFICIGVIASSLLHELCHILCARAFGRKVRVLSYSPTGLYPDLDRGNEISGILIYASGPLSNLLVCTVCLCILHKGYNERLFELFCINAALAAYNLTPVPFSDGSGIMRIALTFFLGEQVGILLCRMLELLFSFMFFVVFSFRFFVYGSGFFSFFCSFVFVIDCISHIKRE